MADPIEVSFCMGSSCFARGNQELLELVEKLIDENNWSERISLSGARCQNKCGQGPNIVVDGVQYSNLDSGALVDLLNEKLGGDPSVTARIRLNERRTTN